MNLIKGEFYRLWRHREWYTFEYTGNEYVVGYSPRAGWLSDIDLSNYEGDILRLADHQSVNKYLAAYKERLGHDRYDENQSPPYRIPWERVENKFEPNINTTYIPTKYCIGQIFQYRQTFCKILDVNQKKPFEYPIYDIEWSNGEKGQLTQDMLQTQCEVSELLWSQVINPKRKWRIW